MRFLLTVICFGCIPLAFSQSDSLPLRNKQVIDTVLKYGPTISPSYAGSVCTEFVIGVLEHFIVLNKEDKTNIRINQPRKSIDDVYLQMENGSPFPKGVVYALTHNGKGIPVQDKKAVLPGDFVQFWYPRSWGHCGIVEHLDLENNRMYLYSSFPSTDGYGVQEFDIPDYCYFVRLK